jgi:hypothetical protein
MVCIPPKLEQYVPAGLLKTRKECIRRKLNWFSGRRASELLDFNLLD